MVKAKANFGKRLTVSGLLNEKPHIYRKSGYTKAQVRTIILTFFRIVTRRILLGERVFLPNHASIGIYREDYKGGQLPPLSRKRFQGETQYANTPGRNRYRYRILADAGPAFRQKGHQDHKIKLEGCVALRTKLQQILTTTNFEYPTNPWL